MNISRIAKNLGRTNLAMGSVVFGTMIRSNGTGGGHDHLSKQTFRAGMTGKQCRKSRKNLAKLTGRKL